MAAGEITVRKDPFEDLIGKKEELDAVAESTELANDPQVLKAMKSSSRDVRDGKVSKLRSILPEKRK